MRRQRSTHTVLLFEVVYTSIHSKPVEVLGYTDFFLGSVYTADFFLESVYTDFFLESVYTDVFPARMSIYILISSRNKYILLDATPRDDKQYIAIDLKKNYYILIPEKQYIHPGGVYTDIYDALLSSSICGYVLIIMPEKKILDMKN